jgi:hypothetical protein
MRFSGKNANYAQNYAEHMAPPLSARRSFTRENPSQNPTLGELDRSIAQTIRHLGHFREGVDSIY